MSRPHNPLRLPVALRHDVERIFTLTDHTDDDDDGCDTSFNGIGYALQVEMLDAVTHAAWRDAAELTKAAGRQPPRRGGDVEEHRRTRARGERWTR